MPGCFAHASALDGEVILNACEPKTILNHILHSPSADSEHKYHLHVNLVRWEKNPEILFI